MPTTETIQIPVEVLDKATQKTDAINKKFSDWSAQMTKQANSYRAIEKQKAQAIAQTNRELEGQKFSFTELSSAIGLARQGFQALKEVYDFAKEGANIEYTAEKFDRLASSIGTTGDVLLNEMKVATKGTLSDMEAMAAASDILALGLANTQEEAIRLATVQAGLAMDMNQLVLTLTNQTTMRFDALGVRVDGFKEKVKALEEQGYSTNDAFKEAFLQQAEQQLKTVGNAADSSVGSFARLEAHLKNIKDEAKEATGKGLAPLAKALADSWDDAERYKEALNVLDKELAKQYQATGRLTPKMYELVESYYSAKGAALVLAESVESYDKKFKQNIETTEGIIGVTEEMTKANQKYLDDIGKASDDYRTYTDKMNDISQERAEIEGKMQADLALGWWEGSEKIQEYKNKLDDLAEKEREYTDDFERNKDKRILAAVEENLAKDGLTEDEMRQIEELGLARGIYTEEAIANMRREREEIQGITDAIMGIPNRTITVEVSATGTGLNLLNSYGDTKAAVGIRQKRDSGGRGVPGMPYIIGPSAQPEAFVPDSPGTFIPNIDQKLGAASGGGTEIDYNKMARTFRQELQRIMQ